MQNILQQQFAQHFPSHSHFLLGLSGGVDSVVLLHLFARQPGLKVRAVHIHHGLSPNADEWVAFCCELCRRLGIELIVRRVKFASGRNLEANARHARYQAISELLEPNEVFVTAHHLDDQAETFFLALKRGSGIQGLRAMQAVGSWQNIAIFRPLLGVSKVEILDYAQQHGLRWITDESNTDDRFERNFLRNQILSALNQRFPQFSRMVARSAAWCGEQQQLIEELLAEELQQRTVSPNGLQIVGFEHFSKAKQQQLLRLWLAQNGVLMPTQPQLQAVISELIFAKNDSNPQVKLGEYVVRRYRQTIFITPEFADTADFSVELNVGEKLALPDQIGTVERTEDSVFFCKKSGESNRLLLPIPLQNQPLTLKLQQHGKVRRYAKPQREEMKKIWQQLAVPPWERCRTPLIFWQDELVFVTKM